MNYLSKCYPAWVITKHAL